MYVNLFLQYFIPLLDTVVFVLERNELANEVDELRTSNNLCTSEQCIKSGTSHGCRANVYVLHTNHTHPHHTWENQCAVGHNKSADVRLDPEAYLSHNLILPMPLCLAISSVVLQSLRSVRDPLRKEQTSNQAASVQF